LSAWRSVGEKMISTNLLKKPVGLLRVAHGLSQ